MKNANSDIIECPISGKQINVSDFYESFSHKKRGKIFPFFRE